MSIDYPIISSPNHQQPKLPPPIASPTMSPKISNSLSSSYFDNITESRESNNENNKLNKASLFKATYWFNDKVGLTGLKNLGNTCYMNSTLQCLNATIPFSKFFIEGKFRYCINHNNKFGMKGNLAQAFSQILLNLSIEKYSFISPLTFRNTICSFAKQFIGNDQHDAQEFLSFLLDGLHEDLKINDLSESEIENITNNSNDNNQSLETLPTPLGSEREWRKYKKLNDSIIVDYFQGQFKNKMECLTCHKTSTTYNSFMYLSLPLPSLKKLGKFSLSLNNCLDTFLKDEIMEGDNAWYCPNCKKFKKSLKTLTISRLPFILLIQLKRFTFNGYNSSDKIETLVNYPIRNLNLTGYTPHINNQFYGISNVDDPNLQQPPFNYDLYGVTNHYGNLQSGHYTAYIMSNGNWYNCADSSITKCYSDKDVVSKFGYMLYYKRVPLMK